MSTPSASVIFGRTHAPNEPWLAKAQPEAALQPDLPIVDTYVHFWHRGEHRYFLEDYGRDVAASGHNVVAIVAVECAAMYRTSGPKHLMCVGETEFQIGMAAMAESGKYTPVALDTAIVAYADLMLGERVREVLEAQQEAANGRLRGIKQTAKWDASAAVRGAMGPGQPGLCLEPAFGKGLDCVAAMGLTLDVSVFHPQIPDVVTLARAHPDASIGLIHTGSPVGHDSYAGQEAQVHATWLAGMKELAKCPNVYVKLGGLLTNLGNFDFTQADAPPTSQFLAALWRPYIEPCIELFGAERCMVECNFPVDKAGYHYGTVWNMFKRITQGCSAHEQGMIFSGTARRVYRLDDQAQFGHLPVRTKTQ